MDYDKDLMIYLIWLCLWLDYSDTFFIENSRIHRSQILYKPLENTKVPLARLKGLKLKPIANPHTPKYSYEVPKMSPRAVPIPIAKVKYESQE